MAPHPPLPPKQRRRERERALLPLPRSTVALAPLLSTVPFTATFSGLPSAAAARNVGNLVSTYLLDPSPLGFAPQFYTQTSLNTGLGVGVGVGVGAGVGVGVGVPVAAALSAATTLPAGEGVGVLAASGSGPTTVVTDAATTNPTTTRSGNSTASSSSSLLTKIASLGEDSSSGNSRGEAADTITISPAAPRLVALPPCGPGPGIARMLTLLLPVAILSFLLVWGFVE